MTLDQAERYKRHIRGVGNRGEGTKRPDNETVKTAAMLLGVLESNGDLPDGETIPNLALFQG
jgi:hypothetical protein